MVDKIQVKIWEDHTYECTTDVIGRAGEGNVTQLELEVPDKMCDYSIYLDFEMPNGEKHRTPKLEVEDGVVTYEVAPFILADSGEIKVQVVSKSQNGKTWKSFIKTYVIKKSVNASGNNEYIQPSGTFEITKNGNYDVTMFASAKVDVPTIGDWDSPMPIEVSTADRMTTILENATNESVGAVYKYTGETTDTYEYGALYIVEVAS